MLNHRTPKAFHCQSPGSPDEVGQPWVLRASSSRTLKEFHISHTGVVLEVRRSVSDNLSSRALTPTMVQPLQGWAVHSLGTQGSAAQAAEPWALTVQRLRRRAPSGSGA